MPTPKKDIKRLTALKSVLLSDWLSLNQIVVIIGTSRRTAYRWLSSLNTEGLFLVSYFSKEKRARLFKLQKDL